MFQKNLKAWRDLVEPWKDDADKILNAITILYFL